MSEEDRPGIVGAGTFVTCCGTDPHIMARLGERLCVSDAVGSMLQRLDWCQGPAPWPADPIPKCRICGSPFLRDRPGGGIQIHLEWRGWWPPAPGST